MALSKLTPEQLAHVRRRLEAGETPFVIAVSMGISRPRLYELLLVSGYRIMTFRRLEVVVPVVEAVS
jgi:hypothetical protein